MSKRASSCSALVIGLVPKMPIVVPFLGPIMVDAEVEPSTGRGIFQGQISKLKCFQIGWHGRYVSAEGQGKTKQDCVYLP